MNLNFYISLLECHSAISPPSVSSFSDCTSTRPSHRETSPLLNPYSDITSSSSDCDSEPDKVPIYSEQPPKEKRQRTTFSPNEVLELEEAFRRWPYLTTFDYEELGQRLGVPAKKCKGELTLDIMELKQRRRCKAIGLTSKNNRSARAFSTFWYIS